MEEVIINKVELSGIVSLDLEQYYPAEEFKAFDLKDHLFMGLILKEKDYREALKNFDWEDYKGKNVFITCTADAVIPMWAYMLTATYLEPVANAVLYGNEEQLKNHLFVKNLSAMDIEEYRDKRVVVKGCGEKQVPEAAYVEVTRLLRPVVKSIMYGEPCSTVPIYKKK
ncbi:MAG: DUF2480 family protein [Chitinophagaceae bacterium]